MVRKYYVTKKRVHEFIEQNLKQFDSVHSMRLECEKVIKELSVDDSSPNQIRFYKRVLKELDF